MWNFLQKGNHVTFMYNFKFFKVDSGTMQTNQNVFSQFMESSLCHSKWRRLFFDMNWSSILQGTVMHEHMDTVKCHTKKVSSILNPNWGKNVYCGHSWVKKHRHMQTPFSPLPYVQMYVCIHQLVNTASHFTGQATQHPIYHEQLWESKSTHLPFGDCTVNVLMILELISSEYGQIICFCLCKLFTDVFRNLMSRSAYSKAHTFSTTCWLLPSFRMFGRFSQKNTLNLWQHNICY
jgi:hypothetical protein